MPNNSTCAVCGETDPSPAWLCLAKLTFCAEPGKPCQYSKEGAERTRTAMEATSARICAAIERDKQAALAGGKTHG